MLPIRPPRPIASLALVTAIALAGCAADPVARPRGEPGQARPPAATGLLADAEAQVRRDHGPDRSGFHLLDRNEDGLRWRLALVDTATRSLDLQYYVWWADESGELLMKHVIDAANRGVKVRLILDDLSTILKDAAQVAERDEAMARLNAHPNIEIRLFNTWNRRGLGGRSYEFIERMERINHRMHNKLMVADNRAAIIGGRNIGNEYFGLSPEFNFRDLDVLGIGPVARQASQVFDSFWNSEWVTPVGGLGVDATTADLRRDYAPLRRRLASAEAVTRFRLDPADRGPAIRALLPQLHPGTSQVHSDKPDLDVPRHHMPKAIRQLVSTTRSELIITNAYIIPDEAAVAELKALGGRGAKVRVLTNSLSSHDVPAVNSHYKAWRRPLIEAGVELHETRADAAIQPLLVDTPPTRAEFMGLHVKAMVVDRQRVFIGSMNLDPRSAHINSEMGVIIDSPGLAGELAAAMERDMQPDNAWRVSLADDGSPRWQAGDQTLDAQPARSLWQRVQDVIFMAFPRDLY